jgi:molybdopterin molybdotransferase
MSSLPSVSLVLSFEEARRVVEGQAAVITAAQTVTVDLVDAADRVLADQITADRDLPPFPRSTRDGYAVRSADLSPIPASLDVIAEIKAGEKLERIPSNIPSGQAAAIMTGAPVPAGADAVVMVEYTSERNQRVEITRPVAPGENVVPTGAEARAGSTLIPQGTRLNATLCAAWWKRDSSQTCCC